MPFEAQFPQWVRFAVERGERVPRWMLAEHAPWPSRDAFYADPRRRELLNWLERTRRLQALWQQPGGAYALLDYANFKGLGDNAQARYEGVGWGLIQVLRTLLSNPIFVPAFVAAAHRVLQRRIDHAPRDESHLWPGWKKRLDRYLKVTK